MLKTLAAKGTPITVTLSVILLIQWILHLIFANGDDKLTISILTPIIPVIIYAFVRLIFIFIRKASSKVFSVYAWFFLVCGTLVIALSTAEFIGVFPNGLTPSLGACVGLIAGVLTEVKKKYNHPNKGR